MICFGRHGDELHIKKENIVFDLYSGKYDYVRCGICWAAGAEGKKFCSVETVESGPVKKVFFHWNKGKLQQSPESKKIISSNISMNEKQNGIINCFENNYIVNTYPFQQIQQSLPVYGHYRVEL